MSEPQLSGTDHELKCPHCSRPFRATLMGGSAARYRGFKCPHCKLFVPLDRVARDVLAEQAE